MKTQHPEMIQVSFYSCGKPKSCFVHAPTLAGKESGCVSQHKEGGEQCLIRWPGDFHYSPAMLNVKNVIEKGNPLLAAGWRERAEKHHNELWESWRKRTSAEVAQ